MKQITVIGASAGVGLLTVQQALQNGHQVVALSRTLATLPDHPNLLKIEGSATRVTDLKKALTGSSAIIVAVGTGNSTKATTLYTDTAIALVESLQQLQLQVPLLVLTGFGAGESGQYQSFLMSLVMRFWLKDVYKNKTAMEDRITSAYKNWAIVRPGRLVDGPFTGKYRVLDRLTKGMTIGKISRVDVAHFLVEQAENFTLPNRYVSLSW